MPAHQFNNKKQFENFLRALGKPLVKFVIRLGELTQFVLRALYHCFTPPFYIKNFGRQLLDMGFYSLPVVGLTTIFAGMVYLSMYASKIPILVSNQHPPRISKSAMAYCSQKRM